MSKVNAFFKRKDIEVSLKRYGIDALGAMAQGLFCTLLVGTILDTLGTQLGISFLAQPLIKIGETGYTIGKFASAMVGPAMAVAIGYALHAPAMVLFSLIPVGYATNVMGGAGGPLAVYVVAIVAAEFGKMVAPALEFKTEGFISGTAAKMFIISGPVIVYGITASVIYGLILCILGG